MACTSLTSHDLPIEMRMTDHALEQSHPERHHHFRAAGGGNVAKIDNVIRIPAEPLAEKFCYLFFRGRIVAANEQVVLPQNSRWFNHDVAIHGVERFHDLGLGESSLNPFAERIGVAKPQDH